MTEMIGHIAETAGHDEPKTRSVTMDRNPRSRCRNHRSRWSEIRTLDLKEAPLADTGRYDSLRGDAMEGVSHA